jgi:hypothetical protein
MSHHMINGRRGFTNFRRIICGFQLPRGGAGGGGGGPWE